MCIIRIFLIAHKKTFRAFLWLMDFSRYFSSNPQRKLSFVTSKPHRSNDDLADQLQQQNINDRPH